MADQKPEHFQGRAATTAQGSYHLRQFYAAEVWRLADDGLDGLGRHVLSGGVGGEVVQEERDLGFLSASAALATTSTIPHRRRIADVDVILDDLVLVRVETGGVVGWQDH